MDRKRAEDDFGRTDEEALNKRWGSVRGVAGFKNVRQRSKSSALQVGEGQSIRGSNWALYDRITAFYISNPKPMIFFPPTPLTSSKSTQKKQPWPPQTHSTSMAETFACRGWLQIILVSIKVPRAHVAPPRFNEAEGRFGLSCKTIDWHVTNLGKVRYSYPPPCAMHLYELLMSDGFDKTMVYAIL